MIFDTDVLVWQMRGSAKASAMVDADVRRQVSVITYMELLQGARDKHEVATIRSFLADLKFELLPLTPNIGHRACICLEEHGLSTGLSLTDALIAATAIENGSPLCSANRKHYRQIHELELRVFVL
jgi:predicted nucleic acid-binding protein